MVPDDSRWPVHLFPGKAWLEAYVARINSSTAYAECAAAWEGDVTLLFEPEPLLRVPHAIYSWLDLWHGKCRAARYDVPPEEGDRAQFVFRAPYSRWKQVIRRELEPVRGMMQGKLKVRGDLEVIVRHVKAADELVRIAGQVPTAFIDES
jgi:putative sterol carrier protein